MQFTQKAIEYYDKFNRNILYCKYIKNSIDNIFLLKFNRNILYCKFERIQQFYHKIKDLIETFCIVNLAPALDTVE